MKKSGEDRLKWAIYESTLSTADAVPLPRWGRQRGGGSAVKRKPTPPRCARQPLPREGARVDIPRIVISSESEKSFLFAGKQKMWG